MRSFVLFLIPCISILIESVFFSQFPFWGAIPGFILIFVTFYSLTNGSRPGFFYGFICGLLEDLYLGRFLGANALAVALTGYIVGKLEVRVFKDNLLVGLGGVIIATVLNSLFMLILTWFSIQEIVINISMLRVLGGQVVLNGVLSIPFYIWYYRAAKNYFKREPDYRGF